MYGPRIKHFRKMMHLSQRDLAEMLHVSQGSVTQWENELRTPDIETIIKLSKIFGVTTDMIIGTELDDGGTRLLLSAAPFIELAQELSPEQRSQWLEFGHWLSEKRRATNQINLSDSESEL